MKESLDLDGYTVPKHIAFIMDGNGRWAKEKGKKRTLGHKEGSKVLKKICNEAYDLGVQYVTVYAFSTENWLRPKEEVAFLFNLLRQYLKDSIKNSVKDNICVRVIGDKKGLPQDIIDSILELEKVSFHHTGLNLQIALNYGSRNEIIRSIQKITKEIYENKLKINEIDEGLFSSYLDTKGLPDPDLMIRTSGEMRLSNFLLWQLAYCEFHFIDKYWPDFNKEDLIYAIKEYNKKVRRFGGLKDED